MRAPWRQRSSPSTTRCGHRARRAARLPVIAEMLDAAQASGDDDLVAEAHLLRAAALLELGRARRTRRAAQLHHPGRRTRSCPWPLGSADPAGDVRSARRPGRGVGAARRTGARTRPGHRRAGRHRLLLHLPLVAGGPRRARAGDRHGRRRSALADVPAAHGLATRRSRRSCRGRRGARRLQRAGHRRSGPGLEALAAAAVVFAVAGSDAQRTWIYDQLRPYAGTHVVVGGCASYHAAVDHHLGALAASLGDTAAAEAHYRAALAMHERLGAAGWARLSEQALAKLTAAASPAANELRLVNGVRLLSFAGQAGPAPGLEGPGRPRDPDRRPRSRRTRPHPGRAHSSPAWAPTRCWTSKQRRRSRPGWTTSTEEIDDADARGQPRASRGATLRTRRAHPRARRGRRTRRPRPKARR